MICKLQAQAASSPGSDWLLMHLSTVQTKQYDQKRQERMAAELKRLLASDGLSDNVYEVAEKSSQQ